ncbi:FAST kinase domain-containing protein 1, mitochondrial [Xiphophorus hellerii]|uniref:FAST kinase domain-containing protein 1, mitochondrial n=1 Tax=Xiphophorus hellerii TaxID=8084 RepID=UPI0013B39493|nr:FAST kinase domain-containing protein 1, mitochondrial [Xiphophorus hellerii]XP_032422736.1 FAST kinase domain-containing protein 1, mitochondrial [Xiphophorus hellerii]XP_032422737.1 FAST kinase domain-containing protein 1, mitochondrial [Xiphophorus hellerii]XP_032422738.1 FAST kinase domain-containing protein 1, mitochondrial [Xiphophorus hellerii]XP_032422739.1 FAST kinase domain-containing protein 1, mitochondrial [Xiphophorus hellerii]XP_032422740.1 FAST kinase domain-containing prote
MFRLQCVRPCLRRLLHQAVGSRDYVLEGLQVCSADIQVLDVVGKNRTKLTVEHVSCAVRMLWDFQKERPELLRTVHLIKCHPQFLTLRVLAENKISLMDDSTLVDMLYAFLRLNVEPHDSLVQQMVSEAWRRVDRLPMPSLSKFAVILNDQLLHSSPLMGHITNILDQKLSSIDNGRVLAALMVSVSNLVSTRLRDALISRAECLLDTVDPLNYNTPRRMVQFLRSIKYIHRPLLEKCNEIFMRNIPRLDAENISIILGLYQSLQFNNCDFRLAAKERLIELIDTSTDPYSFSKLFVALAPISSAEIRERLENTTLLVADEFSAHQALAVVEALEEIQSRNFSLLNKIASVIQKKLHIYRSMEVARITQALFLLHYQNPELFAALRTILVSFLQRSFYPYEVTMLTRVLSMLPSPRLDEDVVWHVDEVIAQCNLSELNTISFAIAKWIRTDPSYRHNTHSKYVRLLQRLSQCGRERLQTANRLDLVLDETKFAPGEWFEEMLLEETFVTLNRMIDQINSSNIADLAFFLTRTNRLHPSLMDRIASVAIEHIDEIHFSATYPTLLPFSVLNYEPAHVDELYDACIKRFTPHISSFDPHLLVLLAYCLALADHFPEELIREIFSIDFLGKLDCQLESLNDSLKMRTKQRLMELNRAVCLESPEFQVPWFHERYCQHLQKKVNGSVSPVQQQIHAMLGGVLGGINFVQAAVITPYFYTIHFECKLDKHLKPLSYSGPSTLQISERGKVLWDSNSLENARDELPAGAHRIAIDFMDSKSFCKNSHHMKGEAVMKRRHLEILGYRVVQIPHFEWNSMELSTPHAWKRYLKKKILG